MRVFILYCFSEAIVTISLWFGEAVEGLKGNVADNIIKTSYGTPVDDIMNSITVGSKGPQLMLDVTTFDALLKFVTEKIPQRGMTGRGAGKVDI
ncbi:hypothetical protein C0J52_02760 [Blattella germanica]|nr:hypothetical protein C0J52_02760 [Blattella germanica]